MDLLADMLITGCYPFQQTESFSEKHSTSAPPKLSKRILSVTDATFHMMQRQEYAGRKVSVIPRANGKI
jgi:hypothetical protein